MIELLSMKKRIRRKNRWVSQVKPKLWQNFAKANETVHLRYAQQNWVSLQTCWEHSWKKRRNGGLHLPNKKSSQATSCRTGMPQRRCICKTSTLGLCRCQNTFILGRFPNQKIVATTERHHVKVCKHRMLKDRYGIADGRRLYRIKTDDLKQHPNAPTVRMVEMVSIVEYSGNPRSVFCAKASGIWDTTAQTRSLSRRSSNKRQPQR